jgi:hypothetical protein
MIREARTQASHSIPFDMTNRQDACVACESESVFKVIGEGKTIHGDVPRSSTVEGK